MDMLTIAEWIIYVGIGSAAVMIFIMLPVVFYLDWKELKHDEERQFEKEKIGYREDSIK